MITTSDTNRDLRPFAPGCAGMSSAPLLRAAMTLNSRNLLTVGLLWLTLLLPVAPAQAQELLPVKASGVVTIDGAEVSVAYEVRLKLAQDAGQLPQLRAHVVVPLPPVLQALEAALDRGRPRDNCAGYHAHNWVVDPVNWSTGLVGEQLSVRLGADVELWQCLKNPFGSPLKNKVEGWARLQLLGRWQVQAQGLALEVEVGEVDAGGALGDVARAWVRAQGSTLGDAIAERLQRESMPAWDLPQALLALGAHLETARFVERDGALSAEFVLSAAPTPSDWLQLQQRFWSDQGDTQ